VRGGIMKVNVLGTEYETYRRNAAEDKKLETRDGYMDSSTKEIVISNLESDDDSKRDLESYIKSVLRHEIIHAFLYESGLDVCSKNEYDSWAVNEEMVDWIAIQFPKILKAFQEVGCL